LEETIEELRTKTRAIEAQNCDLEIEVHWKRSVPVRDELQEVINNVFDRLNDLAIEAS